MARNVPFTEEEVAKLCAAVRMSVQKFTVGTATDTDWNELVRAANVTVVRGEGISPEVIECGKQAQKALLLVYSRYKKLLKWGVNATELQDILAMVDVHDQLVQLSLPGQMLDAMQEAQHRVRIGNTVVFT